MSLEIGRTASPPLGVERPERAAPPGPVARHPAGETLRAAFQVDRVELVPASPPPDVQAEVELAAERAARLAADDRELHFTLDEETGRVIVQVRDLEGQVIRTIPPSHALDIMSGHREVGR